MSTSPEPLVEAARSTVLDTLRLYLGIMRPKVVGLVVVTGLPALLLGQEVWPTPAEAFWILLGTALAGGASSAFNAWVERERDARMARTRHRPLPTAALMPRLVLSYGVVLTVLATLVLAAVGGFVTAAIGVATVAFYVVIYTMWLKPRTPQNIVIGGAAGSTAPLIASAAMGGTGEVSIGAWILFMIVFLWTPPHFWGVAIYRKAEYEAAGFPMMPSVVGDQPTRWRSLGYTLALLPVTWSPVWLGYLGGLYGAASFALGLWFLGLVVRSLVKQQPSYDYRVFRGSLVYLSLLFGAMFIDLLMPGLGA